MRVCVQRALSLRSCLPRHTRTALSISHLQLCRHDPWHWRTGTVAWKGGCHGLVGEFAYVKLMSVLTSASVGELLNLCMIALSILQCPAHKYHSE